MPDACGAQSSVALLTALRLFFAVQMAHDPATARDYYYKEDAQKQAGEIHERMREAYELGSAATAASTTRASDGQANSAPETVTGVSPQPAMMEAVAAAVMRANEAADDVHMS